MSRKITKVRTVKKNLRELPTSKKDILLTCLVDVILDPFNDEREDIINDMIDSMEVFSGMDLDHFKIF